MSKPKAILFFSTGYEALAKDLAAALRAEGSECNLVAMNARITEKQHIVIADAVVIQESNPAAETVAGLYRTCFPETEVHFFNDDGDFAEGAVIDTNSEATDDTPAEEKEVDPSAQVDPPSDDTPEGEAADPAQPEEGATNGEESTVIQ